MSSRTQKTLPKPGTQNQPNLHMNHVNLIGYMTADARTVQLEDGKCITRFTLATKEQYLDTNGTLRQRSQWHLLSAWGRWSKVLEECGAKGVHLAIEGKLVGRFYRAGGQRRFVTEVEINDLVVLP
ncbi:MAG: single-stranded DNA-binding protein [Flavobacteriales bacterium]